MTLLLILDAKEYIFYVLVPTLTLWILFIELQNKKILISKKLLNLIQKLFVLFIPSLIYLSLSFFTSLIPINMFNASLLGLTEDSISYQLKHISTSNYATREPAISFKQLELLKDIDGINKVQSVIVRSVQFMLGYTEKLFHL